MASGGLRADRIKPVMPAGGEDPTSRARTLPSALPPAALFPNRAVRIAIVLLAAGLALVGPPAQVACAGIGTAGGSGVLDVATPEVLPPGRVALTVGARYGSFKVGDHRIYTFLTTPSLTAGLRHGFELSADLPLQAFYRTGTESGAGSLFEKDFSLRQRDLEFRLRTAARAARDRLRLGVQLDGSAPVGSDRYEAIFAPGDSSKIYTRGKWSYGGTILASLDLTGPRGVPLRLHVNAGYLVDPGSAYVYGSPWPYPLALPPPARPSQNDLLRLGAAVEFPIWRLAPFAELTTEQFIHQTERIKAKENPIFFTPGVRFLIPGGIGVATGISFDLSGDDGSTVFSPAGLYPDWEWRATLALGDLVQTRRARMAEANRSRRKEEDLAGTASQAVAYPAPDSAAAPIASAGAARAPAAPPPVSAKDLSAAPIGSEGPPPNPTAPAERDTSRPAPGVEFSLVTPTAPREIDADGDGIPDDRDRCPYLAEDYDGFRDLDGCPDLDNDQDGIPDEDDLCPNAAEDHLAPTPLDGCPVGYFPGGPPTGGRFAVAESLAIPGASTPRLGIGTPLASRAQGAPSMIGLADFDGDGIPDDTDQCPTRKEDIDGYQDDDGCPDLDNDQDGILDVNDRCPNAPETWNGFQDDDGCPDLAPGESAPAAVPSDLDERLARIEALLAGGVPAAPVPAAGSGSLRRGPDRTTGDLLADFDGDGVSDLYDRCPEIPEDVDGWQDSDGCPDLDNDGDGILDANDKCPNAPETWNGFQDDDGCPDNLPGASVEQEGQGRRDSLATRPPDRRESTADAPATGAAAQSSLLAVIRFPLGESTLDDGAHRQLEDVADRMARDPGLTVVAIGHTDDRGEAAYNLIVSQSRAESVRDYLVGIGVARERILTQGVGEEDPVASNTTASGRALNRRVEVRTR